MTVWGLLTVWWVHKADIPRGVLWISEATVALLGIWTVRAIGQVWRGISWKPNPAIPVPADRSCTSQPGTQQTTQLWRDKVGIGSLEQLLSQSAQKISTGVLLTCRVIERHGLEGILRHISRAVIASGHIIHRAVEQQGLEGIPRYISRAVIASARIAHRIVEQKGLEGLVRHAVQSILALSRHVQRWHTGRLRHKLAWVMGGLALAILTALFCS